MLSKKMAVSLTSLITILALAAMPVSAFDVKFDAHDISYAGDIQIERAGTVVVYVNFGKVVTLADVNKAFMQTATAGAEGDKHANTISEIDILNYHGAVIDVEGNAIQIADREVDDRLTTTQANRIQAGKDYTITITIPETQRPTGDAAFDKNDHAYRLRLYLPAKAITEADRNAGATSNKGFHDKIFLVGDEPASVASRSPQPMKMELAPGVLVPDAGFKGDSFNIIVTLSEQPKENKLTKDHFDVAEGAAADGVYLGAIDPIDGPDDGATADPATGRNGMHERYLVKITPAKKDATLVVKLKSFEDQEIYTYAEGATGAINGSGPNDWDPPVSELDRIETHSKLTVKINNKPADAIKTGGFEVKIPNETRIPKGGFVVLATNLGGSGVADNPENDKDEPKATARTPAQLLYNLVQVDKLPNLEAFLVNGGTIDLEGPEGADGRPKLYISEIMWGSDASLSPNNNSQWIEIANPGDSILTGDGTHTLKFYGPNETPPTQTADDPSDRVGTVGAGGYWGNMLRGQSGRTGTGETAAEQVAVVPTQALVSMHRGAMGADGMPPDGTMASNWTASMAPALNFDTSKVGIRIGTPGAAPVAYPATPPPPAEPTPAPVVPVAGASDIMITEIMFDTGNGRLPQWIELTNTSGAEKSLAGWSVMVANSDADADVIGSNVSINLSGTIGVGGGTGAGGTMGKSMVLAAGTGRSNLNKQVMDVSSQLGQKGRYKLISDMAFMISLIPPQTTGILTPGDEAGNLDAATAWDLDMDENGRSSLIRVTDNGMKADGTAMSSWILASDTNLVAGPATWYGSDDDAGTPGYDAGGPLPVELSHFRPARDKATGAVVITWSTQSELNNAGFFIKRSQQRDGEFKVINATMIAGAGTTSEKQTYTYTDTTAQPNVVYYYQIEDVSLDGQRQTLTLGTRLKGHIGAAGKLTATWGELKSSNE